VVIKSEDKMRILITGGAGFVGSHLVERYLELGHEVYVIDDLSTGSRDNLENACERFNGSIFLTVDTILNRDVMLGLVGTCDLVVHLAAAVGVQYILDNPLSSIITNVQGTAVVLELCDKFKKRILIVSTSEVYGKHTHAPLLETDDIIYGPSSKFRWSYAAAKLMDEFTALAYHRTTELPVVIVRLFNTVGPRQTGRYGMVIPRFIQSALNNTPIKIFGNGQQTRTFVHVTDVINAIVQLMEQNNVDGEVFNIGGNQEITIEDLAKRVVKETASTSEITYLPYEKAFSPDFEDIQRRVPSVEKLQKVIDWEPMYSLDAILSNIINEVQKS